MKKNNTYAFTLVELIVVITILAILGTIAFISMRNYTQSARNSSRIADMKVIEKAMSLLNTTGLSYPTPDGATSITYSGGLAWTQGIFSTGSLAYIKRISHVPKDPLFGIHYSYSLSGNGESYQIAAALEGNIAYTPNPFISEVHAISAYNFYGYTLGNYITYDTPVLFGTGCSIIATPSILLSDIPTGGILLDGSIHNYTYSKSEHIPNSYSGSITSTSPSGGFQTVEVLNSCSIDTIGELELYIAKLSTAYIGLSSFSKFENLIFNSNSKSFQLTAIGNLQNYGIHVDEGVISTLKSPSPEYVFVDTFSNTDGTSLLSGHTPSSSGSWLMVGAGDNSAYSISGNTLEKIIGSQTIIAPFPTPLILDKNYSLAFDIENFASGDIFAYLRYTDSNNYYRLQLSPSGYPVTSSGYEVTRMVGGTVSILETIGEAISVGDNISFSVSGDTVIFELNGIEKTNIVASGLNAVGYPAIMLENNGARIDNYTLIYK